MKTVDKFEKVNELARRRGFFWPSYEIYGGVSGFINWGPLGSVLKRKVEDKFRDLFLRRLGFYEIESPVINPEIVFKASGHVDHFKEPMVECSECKKNFRADHLLQEFANLSSQETDKMSLEDIKGEIEKREIKCPECGGTFSEPKYFLTMFKTTIGPYSDAIGYGRPEAAQGVFVEFKRLYEQTREKLPIGFATIGHALRNEISPRQGPIRLREFTIIDLEFFFDPENPKCPLLGEVADETLKLILAEDRLRGSEVLIDFGVSEALAKGHIKTEWQAFFMALAKRFLVDLGVPEDKQYFIEKLGWERAHYSVQGFDQEVHLERWGWIEVAGFNYRTDYDLKGHMEKSGVDMRVFKAGRKKTIKTEESGRRFIPHVIEPSFGSDRLAYVALEYAYTTKNGRAILTLPRDIAPVQLAVLPLVSKNGLSEKAKQLHTMLIREGFMVEYDEAGSIGRRYARFDEIGTPLCLTADYRTLEDETVTIRDRDSWKQVRTEIKDLPRLLYDYFRFKIDFEDLGSTF